MQAFFPSAEMLIGGRQKNEAHTSEEKLLYPSCFCSIPVLYFY